MLNLRRSAERGRASHGWLESRFTFSFADYYDPSHMGFRDLRVINEDRVQPETGFGMHAHRDMEIITIPLEGELEHRDSLGNGGVIRPGEVQRMSAGTGIVHSEMNPGRTPVHFLQIWIRPERAGLPPGYEQRSFPDEEKHNKLRLVASANPGDSALTIHQDVALYEAHLDAGSEVHYELEPGRHAWVQVARGAIDLTCEDRTERLSQGDGAAVSEAPSLDLKGVEDADVLLFDLI